MGHEDIFQIAVKVLIQNEEGKLLMLKLPSKTIEGITKEYWDLPGGRMQRNESLEQTLQREVREEIGLQHLSPITPFFMTPSKIRIPLQERDAGLFFVFFLCSLSSPHSIQLSHEHVSFDWIEPRQAAQLLKENFSVEFVEKVGAITSSREAIY
jgi:8-oxo-dGTP pyrophosphatase MutT (NUDIX family)